MKLSMIASMLVMSTFLITFGVLAYGYIRNTTLDGIRTNVYQLFLKAEHIYLHTGEGMQKMEYVIQRALSLLPNWAKFFITEELLRKVVQLWFEAIKDLLDDGKVNKSVEVK